MKRRYLRLHGTRYACRPRYVSQDSLDPLARFFYDVLKHEKYGERRISYLTRSFGLPTRVIEEVLAELVSKKHAMISLREGEIEHEIHPILEPQRPREYDDGPEIILWQDHWTGGLLPEPVANMYAKRPPARSEIATLPLDHHAKLPGFLNIADASLVALLRRTQPQLAFGTGNDWPLDRLVGRRRIDGQILWIPLGEVPLQDRTVHYVEAPEVPFWFTQAWSAASRGVHNESAADPLAVALAERDYMLQGDEGSGDELLRGWDLHEVVDRWVQAVDDALDHPESIRRQTDVFALTGRYERLRERLSAVTWAHLRPTEKWSHLDEALRDAAHFVTVVLPDITRDSLRRLKKILERSLPKSLPLCIVRGRPIDEDNASARMRVEALQELLDVQTQEGSPLRKVLVADGAGIMDEFILVDGQRVWLGPSGSVLADGRSPMLQIRGAEAVAPLRGALLSSISNDTKGRDWLHDQSLPRGPSPVLGAYLDTERAPVTEVLTRLGSFHQSFLADIVDPQRNDEVALREGLPEERIHDFEKLRLDLGTGKISEPFCTAVHVADVDHLGLLAAILRPRGNARSRQSTLRIFVDTLGAPKILESLAGALSPLLEAGWSVELLWGVESEEETRRSLELAASMRAMVPDPRFQLRYRRERLGIRAVTFDDVVCIGGYEWLHDLESSPGSSTRHSFVMRAPWIVRELEVIAQHMRIATSQAV